MLWVLVLVGGGLGAVARYGVGVLMLHQLGPTFPWATMAVNVAGAFVIGFVVVLADEFGTVGTPLRTFLVVGILGGFTTFSSFSVETLRLWERDVPLLAAANVAGNVALCLAAVTLGVAAARSLK